MTQTPSAGADTARTTEAARLLAAARRTVTAINSLPEAVAPRSVAEAYATQDALVDVLGSAIVGWKVGATAVAIQQRLGTNEPFAGPLLAGSVFESPGRLNAGAYLHTAIECEFAFRMGRTLPVRAEPYAEAEVADAVCEIIPAIEVVAPSFEQILGGALLDRIADLGVTAGLVHGQATSPQAFPLAKLVAHGVALRIDGAETARGTGDLVLGDPLRSLTWLANHLRQRGRDLSAGAIVSTGSMTGITQLAIGQTAVADFGLLGTVTARFA